MNYRTNNPLPIVFPSWYLHQRMTLPHWVDKELQMLPADFTGQVVLECFRGGVTRVETKTSRQAPKPVEAVRHALSA